MPLTTYTSGEVLTAASLNANLSFASTNGGLVFVKSQVIGSAVASVNVTSAFSTTYDSYKIIINGGVGSANQDLFLKLGSTTTGYYYSQQFVSYAGVGTSSGAANQASFGFITYNTNTLFVNIEVHNPFLSSPTVVNSINVDPTITGRTSAAQGYLANSTSYTDFTLTPGGGTITGGTIYIYGYAKA